MVHEAEGLDLRMLIARKGNIPVQIRPVISEAYRRGISSRKKMECVRRIET